MLTTSGGGGGGGGGSFTAPYTTQPGGQTAVANSGLADGGIVVSTAPTLTAGQYENLNITTNGYLLAQVLGTVSVSNFPTSFQVSNFPATQPVSGTVAVSNFPATQPVSVATTLNVNVTNPTAAPTTQPVSIASTVPVLVTNSTAAPTTQPVTFPSPQPVYQATALPSGTNTIGSIGNTAFGISGPLPTGSNAIGSVTVSNTVATTQVYPYSLASGGQTGTTGSGVGVLGQYNSTALALTNGQVAPLQLDANGYLAVDVKVGGGGGGSTTFPYSLVTQGQTAQANSGLGILGVYNSTAPALTTGQAAPLQLDASGNEYVNFNAGFGSAAATPSFTRVTGLGGNLASVNATVNDSQTLAAGSLSVEAYVMGYNGTTLDKLRTASIGNNVSATGLQIHVPYVQYLSALPTLTSGQYGATQGSVNGIPYTGTAAVTGVGATHYNETAVTTSAVNNICTVACTAFDIEAINTSGVLCYIQQFNTLAASVTLGTTAPTRIFVVGATAGTMAADSIPPTVGSAMTTAWSYATTTTPTGSTACGSSVYVTADYK